MEFSLYIEFSSYMDMDHMDFFDFRVKDIKDFYLRDIWHWFISARDVLVFMYHKNI